MGRSSKPMAMGGDGRIPRTGRRGVTIHDVARAAEVSIGTASKALNGAGQLRDETRAKVLETAQLTRLPAE